MGLNYMSITEDRIDLFALFYNNGTAIISLTALLKMHHIFNFHIWTLIDVAASIAEVSYWLWII